MPTRGGLYLAALLLVACGSEQGRNESSGKKRPSQLRDVCTASVKLSADEILYLADTPEAPETSELTSRMNRGLPRGLRARMTGFEATSGARHYDFRYESESGMPLCEHLARAHVVGDQTLVNGELSAKTLLRGEISLAGLVWQNEQRTAEAAARSLGLGPRPIEVLKAERCFTLGEHGPQAAWEISFKSGAGFYGALANGERVVHAEPRTFNLEGTARVYDSGPVGGTLVDVPLTDLEPGDHLESSRFKSLVKGGTAPAAEANRVYSYDPSDQRFAEVSVFAHVEQMAAWLTRPEHDYDLGDCLPIEVQSHTVFDLPSGGTTVNNADYLPAEYNNESGFPAIRVGDGDGEVLANIHLDFDAVAHELGHHLVFRRMTSRTFWESKVLHEGLADYLVFAKTGNACIGESLCPAGSGACALQGACLRSGENTLRFDDQDLSPEYHLQSQVVSGMLWDLGKEADLGQDLVARLLIKGVDYLLPASTYADFVKAMMAADLELNAGRNACRIQDRAVARGFGDDVQALDCASYEKARQ